MVQHLSKTREKICNMCGESCLIYTVSDNAPLCNDCVPVSKKMKKILSESQMIKLILEGDKNPEKQMEIGE